EQHVIATPLPRGIALRSPQVADRIDRERHLEYEDHAQAIAIEEAVHTEERVSGRCQQESGEHPEAVEPNQFRIPGEISYHGRVRIHQIARKEPANMAIPKAGYDRRVWVIRAIRMAVMQSMVNGPPQRPLLERGAT